MILDATVHPIVSICDAIELVNLRPCGIATLLLSLIDTLGDPGIKDFTRWPKPLCERDTVCCPVDVVVDGLSAILRGLLLGPLIEYGLRDLVERTGELKVHVLRRNRRLCELRAHGVGVATHREL